MFSLKDYTKRTSICIYWLFFIPIVLNLILQLTNINFIFKYNLIYIQLSVADKALDQHISEKKIWNCLLVLQEQL